MLNFLIANISTDSRHSDEYTSFCCTLYLGDLLLSRLKQNSSRNSQ